MKTFSLIASIVDAFAPSLKKEARRRDALYSPIDSPIAPPITAPRMKMPNNEKILRQARVIYHFLLSYNAGDKARGH
jgi:hypothetical protein